MKLVEPALRPEDKNMLLLPWMDPENFNPGYLMRSMHLLSRRGDKPEWQHTQDHWVEKDALPKIDLDDPIFVYKRAVARDQTISLCRKLVSTVAFLKLS